MKKGSAERLMMIFLMLNYYCLDRIIVKNEVKNNLIVVTTWIQITMLLLPTYYGSVCTGLVLCFFSLFKRSLINIRNL